MRDGASAALLPLDEAKARSSPALRSAIVFTAVVAAYALWLALALPTNVDVSWLIVVCGRLLDGERLTVDVMEVNPPLSVWLYMPYMLLERLAGGRAEIWMAGGVVAAGLASVAVSGRMLAGADALYRTPRAAVLLPVLAFLVLCLFPGEFGQREQFATIAVLPWLALQCVRQRDPHFAAPGRWQVVLAGLCAGVVVAIKPPHFALALVIPSACLAVQRRSWKPLFVVENLLGAALVAAYAVSILLFQPTFLSDVLPFVAEVYLPFREPLPDLLTNWPQTVLLLAMLAIMAAGGLRRLHSDAAIPLLSACGFLLAFIVMGKGWPNHAWPMLALAVAGFAVQLVRTESIAALTPVGKAAAIAGCLLVMKATFLMQKAPLLEDRTSLERMTAPISGSRPTIVSLAARMQAAHPLTRMVGGDFVSRYPSAWAVYNADLLARDAADSETRLRLQAIRDALIEEFAEEIEVEKPDIVLHGAEAGQRSVELMLGNPRIAAALKSYEVAAQAGDVTVYRRADAAGGSAADVSR